MMKLNETQLPNEMNKKQGCKEGRAIVDNHIVRKCADPFPPSYFQKQTCQTAKKSFNFLCFNLLLLQKREATNLNAHVF